MGQLLLTCSRCPDFKFSVGDRLELSGIQFTPLKRRSGLDTDKTVLSCMAWRCELALGPIGLLQSASGQAYSKEFFRGAQFQKFMYDVMH